MARKAYVGVNTEVPIYDETLSDFVITTEDVAQQYFIITNTDTDYSFNVNSWKGNIAWSNSNWADEDNPDAQSDTSSGLAFKAKMDMPSFEFDWYVSSEEGYDELIIMKNNEEIIHTSGEDEGIWKGALIKGDIIQAYYIKDGGSYEGSDFAMIGNIFNTNINTMNGSSY